MVLPLLLISETKMSRNPVTPSVGLSPAMKVAGIALESHEARIVGDRGVIAVAVGLNVPHPDRDARCLAHDVSVANENIAEPIAVDAGGSEEVGGVALERHEHPAAEDVAGNRWVEAAAVALHIGRIAVGK
jgi:hypothetical protein